MRLNKFEFISILISRKDKRHDILLSKEKESFSSPFHSVINRCKKMDSKHSNTCKMSLDLRIRNLGKFGITVFILKRPGSQLNNRVPDRSSLPRIAREPWTNQRPGTVECGSNLCRIQHSGTKVGSSEIVFYLVYFFLFYNFLDKLFVSSTLRLIFPFYPYYIYLLWIRKKII